MLDRGFERGDFFNDVDVVAFELADPAEGLEPFFPFALGIQPARRFPEPETSNEKKTAGDQLDRKWYLPLATGGTHGLGQCVLKFKVRIWSYTRLF